MNIAEKIKKLRAEKGKTQEQVANELKIGIQTLRNYENVKNPRNPNPNILLKLAEYFDVSTEYLLNEDVENKAKDNIEIGRQLKLSDVAIEKIIQVNNNAKNNIVNDFIINTDAQDFWNKIDEYIELNKEKNLSEIQKERMQVLEYCLTMNFTRILKNMSR